MRRLLTLIALGAACAGGGTLAAMAFAAEPPPTSVLYDRRVFVPAEDLDVVVDKDARGVLLPRAEFEKLLERARQEAADHPPPPAATVVHRCEYAGRVAGDQLLITATAELQQLTPGWQAWVFPLQRLAVERATLDGEPAFVGRNAEGALTVFIPQAGKHELKLELSTELATLGSDQAAAFALLQSSAGALTITLPPGKRLLVGGLQLERPAPGDQPAEYRVAVGGLASLQLRITDRAAERVADALTFATTGYGLFVAPGEVTWHALTTLQVFGRTLDRVTLSVPGYLEIADVESTGLDAWELADDPANPQRTLITLTYGQPFDGSRKLSVRGVMPVPAGEAWLVPPLVVAQATSHVGQVVVQTPAGVRLQVAELDGVRRATAQHKPVSDMPDDMARFGAVDSLRFDAWREDFTLRLVTQPKERELQIAVAAMLDLADEGVRLQAAITVTPRYAPLFELDVAVPAEWSMVSAALGDRPLRWELVPQQAGEHHVRLTLPTALAAGSTAAVQLELRRDVEGWPPEKEAVSLAIPEIVLPQATLAETAYVVQAPGDVELTIDDLAGLDPQPLKADWERLRFQSQDTRYGGQLKATRKAAREAAQTIGFYRVDQQTFHAYLQAGVEMAGGGTRAVTVSLPEMVGADVRFQAVGATLVEQQQLPAADGRRRWRLQFAERLQRGVWLWTEVELPRGEAQEIVAPSLHVEGAGREHGFLFVEGGPEQRLSLTAVDAQGQPLSEIDLLEAPAPLRYVPRERLVAMYRSVAPGARLTIAEQRFDKSSVPSAVCQRLDVTSILGKTGELQLRATYQLRLAGVQSLRIRLPESAVLWAALVDNQPVEIRRAEGLYLIPLAVTSGATTAHQLQLFYRDKAPSLRGAGELTQSPPDLTVLSGQGTGQPVEVLEQTWEVLHPAETLVIDSRGALEPDKDQPLDQPSWLAAWQALIGVPTWQAVGRGLFAIVVGAGAVALLLLLYRRHGLRGVVAGVAVLGSLGVLALCTLLPGGQSAAVPYSGAMAPKASATPAAALDRAPAWGEGKPDGMVADFALAAPTSGPAAPPMAGSGLVAEGMPALNKSLEENLDRSGLARRKLNEQEQIAPPGARDGLKLDGLAEAKKEASSEKQAPRFAPEAAPQSRALGLADAKRAGKPEAADPFRPEDKPMAAEPQPDAALGREVAEQAAAMPAPAGAEAGVAGGALAGRSLSRLSAGVGLMSLSLAFEAPPGSVRKAFRYRGAGATTSTELKLHYVDRRTGVAGRWFFLVCGAFLGWLARRSSVSWKGTLLAGGVALSWGLLPLAPVVWQLVLDAVFFVTCGAAAAWIVWAFGSALQNCCRWCCLGRGSAGLLLAAALAPHAAVDAQEKPVAKPLPPRVTSLTFPYDLAAAPTAADRVLVPHDKFVELWRLAHPEKPLIGPAPHDGGVMEALYAAELRVPEGHPEDAAVHVQARLALRSYVAGQAQFALPFKSVAVSAATLDGKPAALTVREGGGLQIVVGSAGLHVLDLAFAIPAKLSGETGSFSLPLDPVPAARLSFALPQPGLAVRVNGSTSIYRRVTVEDRQTVEWPVDRGGELSVSWQPEQAQGGAAAVIHVDSVTAVNIADAGVTVSAGFQYRVRQGVIRDVSVLVPENLRLKSVVGPDVGGWELVGAGGQRKLRIFLRRNVGDTTPLTVDFFLDHRVAATAQTFAAPEIVPSDATSDVGQVAIYAGEQIALRAEQVAALQQLDVAGFQPAVPVTRPEAPPQLLYRFSRRPWSLSLRTNRLATQMQVAAQHGVLISHRKQQLTSRFVCDLSIVPQSTLAFRVPAGRVVLDVQSPDLKDWYSTKTEDALIVTLEYASPKQGPVEVVLLTTAPRDPAQAAVSVAVPTAVGGERRQQHLAVWLESGLSAVLANLGGWKSIDAGQTPDNLRSLRPQPPQLAFQSTAAEPAPVDLTVTAAAPRLTAASLSAVTVTDVAIVYGLVLQWQITQASAESLVFDTPDWLAGQLDFQGSGIREVSHAAAGPGKTRWTIGLRGPVTGQYTAAATATLPPAVDRIAAPALTFIGSAGAPLETQQHYALLLNTSLGQLSAVDPSLTEPVQREDVPLVVRQELVDQATEFVRIKTAGAAPSWSLQRFAAAAAAPASVNLADVVSVLARDGTYRAAVGYTIKNRTRQFLAVRLPEGATLLSVAVAGRPSRSVGHTLPAGPAHLIALPKTSVSDLSFRVDLIYRGQLRSSLPSRTDLWRQDLDLPAPEVVSQEESEEFGIPVARTRWTVYLPEDLDAAPLRDPKRHNLNVLRSADGDDVGVRVLMQDFDELLGVLSNPSNGRNRYAAYNNLKQLSTSIQAQVRGGSEVAADVAKLQDRFSKLSQDVQVDEMRQVIVGNGAVSSDGEISGRVSNDIQQQLEQASRGNLVIVQDNAGAGVTFSDQFDTNFNFRLVQPPAGAKAAAAQAAKDAAPILSNSIEARNYYQSLNEDQLQRLNRELKVRRGEQQQGQTPPQEPFFGQSFGVNAAGDLSLKDQRAGGMGGFGGGGGFAGAPGGVPMRGRASGIERLGEQQLPVRQDGVVALHDLMVGGAAAVDGRGVAVGEGMAASGGQWTQTGALSLPIELPLGGQQLRFVKAGGEAKLALALRPRQSLGFGLGVAWAAGCLAVAALIAVGLLRRSRLARHVPLLLALIAAVGVVVLPGVAALLAYLAFLGFAASTAWVHRQPVAR